MICSTCTIYAVFSKTNVAAPHHVAILSDDAVRVASANNGAKGLLFKKKTKVPLCYAKKANMSIRL